MIEGRFAPALVLLLLAGSFSFGGRLGYSPSTFEWLQADAPENPKTKAAVVARFGEPTWKSNEGGLELWHDLIPKHRANVAGRWRPATSRQTIVGVVIPLWWNTSADENLRIAFRQDDVVAIEVLTEKRSGVFCGVTIDHGAPGCQ